MNYVIVFSIYVFIYLFIIYICNKDSFVVNLNINKESKFVDLTEKYLKLEQKPIDNSTGIRIDKDFLFFVDSLTNKTIYEDVPAHMEIMSDSSTSNVKNIDQHELDNIINIIINIINKSLNTQFVLLNKGIIEITNMTVKNNKISKEYIIPIFIYNKSINYVKGIKINCIYNIFYNKTGDIRIKSIIPIEKIDFNESLLPSISLTDKYSNSNINNTTPQILVTDKDIEIETNRKIKLQKIKDTYTCFGIPESQYIQTKSECTSFGGIWDKAVNNDEECPFFQSNKNYLNNRGGVKNDYCELPSGIQSNGYRYYNSDSHSIPLCYNCKHNLIGQGTLGKCCKIQSENKNLKSPDFKYPGDKLDRYNSRHILALQNLNYE